jgi:hypothetical protein
MLETPIPAIVNCNDAVKKNIEEYSTSKGPLPEFTTKDHCPIAVNDIRPLVRAAESKGAYSPDGLHSKSGTRGREFEESTSNANCMVVLHP